jgi:hypothetical protein
MRVDTDVRCPGDFGADAGARLPAPAARRRTRMPMRGGVHERGAGLVGEPPWTSVCASRHRQVAPVYNPCNQIRRRIVVRFLLRHALPSAAAGVSGPSPPRIIFAIYPSRGVATGAPSATVIGDPAAHRVVIGGAVVDRWALHLLARRSLHPFGAGAQYLARALRH